MNVTLNIYPFKIINIFHSTISLCRDGNFVELSFSVGGLTVSRNSYHTKPMLEFPLGLATVSAEQAIEIARKFCARPYNIVTNNCNHFCSYMSAALSVGNTPATVTNQASCARQRFADAASNFIGAASSALDGIVRCVIKHRKNAEL